MRSVALPSLLAAALVACGGYLGVREPQLTPYNTRWERRLQRTARTELACRNVRLIPLSDSIIQADGCNRVAEYGLFCLGSRNCNWRAFEGVTARASRELACHEAALAISAPSALRRDVMGCGRSATYELGCSAVHCTWNATAMSGPVAPIEVVAVSSSTDEAVIPPPPGAAPETSGGSGEVVIPPPPGAAPDPSTAPPGSSAPPSTATDDVVIPPPPS